jgi:hypothetical protein
VNRTFALCIFGLSAFCPGCSLVWTGAHNIAAETQRCLDELAESRRNQSWAEAAWENVRQRRPCWAPSEDYEAGFKAGFVDCLSAGGSGEPPPVPPQPYWQTTYQTPGGHRAVKDWFAGFRHGAAAAGEGGYRRWVVLPCPAGNPRQAPPPHPPLPAEPAPGFGPDMELPVPPDGMPEQLPPPRPVPPAGPELERPPVRGRGEAPPSTVILRVRAAPGGSAETSHQAPYQEAGGDAGEQVPEAPAQPLMLEDESNRTSADDPAAAPSTPPRFQLFLEPLPAPVSAPPAFAGSFLEALRQKR